MLLAGCNLSQPVQPTATPTITPIPSATSTPTVVPSPTVPPTPTIEPRIALTSGSGALIDGQFEAAAAAYQQVLDQGTAAPDDARAEAAFGAGQAALREGLFGDAVDALTVLIEQFPTGDRAAQAHFLRGDAYLGLSRWQQALDDFRAYLSLRPGLIDSYAYERSGDALLGLGQTADALAAYEQAISASRTATLQTSLRQRMAQVYLQNGQLKQAIAEYDAILAAAVDTAARAPIELAAAQVQLEHGASDAGLERMQHLFDSVPLRPEAYEAMRALLDAGRELDLLEQARVRFAHADYRDVIDLLNTYTTVTPMTEIPSEVQLLLGRSYRAIGSFGAADVAFETVVTQYPQDAAFGAALLEQAETKFSAGDLDGAIAQYVGIADSYDYLPEAAEALLRAGTLLTGNSRPTEARAIFSRLADKYPKTQQAHDGLIMAATAAFKSGDYAAAELFYGLLALNSTGEDQASAYYMAGRMALQQGDTRKAQQSFQLARSAAPDSYFAARAQDIVDGRAPFDPPASPRLQFDDAADRDAAETWLRATFTLTPTGPLWPLSDALAADPRWTRGRELWTVGAYDEANSEFADLLNAYKDDGLASYQLATALRDLSVYDQSIVAVANVIRTAGVGTLDAPAYLARMRYPIYYADVVAKAAAERKLDPLLIFALIRNESLFDTYATAAAGEKGLMQIIPSTADALAVQLRWPRYQPALLFRPNVNVSFGAAYLDEQLQRFDGNVVAAPAGYNTGPRRAQGWLELSGGDPDLYISTISVPHTRDYVERLYSYYAIYRALYGA